MATGQADDAAAAALERIATLGPTIRRDAERIERERRLTPDVLAGLYDARLYRMLLPKTYGGLELSPPAFARCMVALAGHDASTAWCVGQANGCAMTAAYLEPAVSRRIWGDDPKGVLAWGPGPGKALRSGDGYRVTGNWSFASGGRHATWLGGVATVCDADGTPRRRADGAVEQRTVMFPAETVDMRDIWQVIGLRGTASDGYAVDDLQVPHAHTVARDAADERRLDGMLYRYPAMTLFAHGFAGVALGIAASVMQSFLELAQDKTPRFAKGRLADNHLVQAEVALSEARIGAARAYLLSEAAAIWAEVSATGTLSVANRVRIRRAATYAIHEAKAAVDTLYDAAGATAIFEANPFERRFRDIHTVSQQLQGRKNHMQVVGAWMLGHEPDLNIL